MPRRQTRAARVSETVAASRPLGSPVRRRVNEAPRPDRLALVVVAAAAVVVAVVVVGLVRPAPAPAPVRAERPGLVAEKALARLDAIPDPLETAVGDARRAIAQARVALDAPTAERARLLDRARARVQTARSRLLALEDGASADQRAAIGAANAALQALLLQLDDQR